MLENILLAVIQAGTEFLPISSSGYLVLVSNLISKPNLYFFITLHTASLFAVIIFTRNELAHLFRFEGEYAKWWLYLFIGIIPAAVAGVFFKDFIEEVFSSLFFVGISFFITGLVLYMTKFHKKPPTGLNAEKSLLIGLIQALALLPGISRSGVTISTALMTGVEKEKAIKFSFLLFIPLSVGALILNYVSGNGVIEGEGFYLNASLILSFMVCLVMSLIFLNLMFHIIKKAKLWLFSFYCFAIGTFTLLYYYLS